MEADYFAGPLVDVATVLVTSNLPFSTDQPLR